MTREEEIKRAAIDYERLSNRICPDMQSFIDGARWADKYAKSPWISVKDDLPCNHKELIHSNYTDRVLTMSRYGYTEVAFMSKMEEDAWEWSNLIVVLYWMPIPKMTEE